MDGIFLRGVDAPQEEKIDLILRNPYMASIYGPKNSGGKKGKKRKKEEKRKLKNDVARLAFTLGMTTYENKMLRNMMVLALAAQRGTLHEEPIEVGFEVIGGK